MGDIVFLNSGRIIDCDAEPYLSPHDFRDGWEIVYHKKGGQFLFSPASIELFVADGQRSDEGLTVNQMRTELAGKPVLNANVHGFLAENPRFIPSAWMVKLRPSTPWILFWGTIFKNRKGALYVRCLHWRASGMSDILETSSYFPIDRYPYWEDHLAALRAYQTG